MVINVVKTKPDSKSRRPQPGSQVIPSGAKTRVFSNAAEKGKAKQQTEETQQYKDLLKKYSIRVAEAGSVKKCIERGVLPSELKEMLLELLNKAVEELFKKNGSTCQSILFRANSQ
jgi:hypothetical protein